MDYMDIRVSVFTAESFKSKGVKQLFVEQLVGAWYSVNIHSLLVYHLLHVYTLR